MQEAEMSTGERPFIEILQDVRFWVIHLLTITSLFTAGLFCVLSGLVRLVFPTALSHDGFVEILNERFSVLSMVAFGISRHQDAANANE